MTDGSSALASASISPRRSVRERAWRFVVVGGVCALAAYVVFVALVELGLHFMCANVAGWAAGLGMSFVLNRRVTFGIRGKERRAQQFGLFTLGSLLQLAITSAGYALLMGRFGLDASLSFFINAAVTTGLTFTYLNLVAFRAR